MGKLIVIEGTDGSGKATQTGLLCAFLEEQGRTVKRLEFPRYKEESSALVRLYLGGAFGDQPEDVKRLRRLHLFRGGQVRLLQAGLGQRL